MTMASNLMLAFWNFKILLLDIDFYFFKLARHYDSIEPIFIFQCHFSRLFSLVFNILASCMWRRKNTDTLCKWYLPPTPISHYFPNTPCNLQKVSVSYTMSLIFLCMFNQNMLSLTKAQNTHRNFTKKMISTIF